MVNSITKYSNLKNKMRLPYLLISTLVFLLLPYACVAIYQFQISTWSGANYRGLEGPAKTAYTKGSKYMYENQQGEVYTTLTSDNALCKIDSNGIIHLVAGTPGSSGDSTGLASATKLYYPQVITGDANGNVYFVDNYRIKKFNTSGYVELLAGTGNYGSYSASQENVLATTVGFGSLRGIAVSSITGIVYFSDNGYCIRKVNTTGYLSKFAGTCGGSGSVNGLALSAKFYNPTGLFINGTDMYAADNHCVRKIENFETNAIVSTVAGHCTTSGNTNNAVALSARFYNIDAIAVYQNVMFISDKGNDLVRKWDMTTDEVTTVAGGGTEVVDGGNPLQAVLTDPCGIIVRQDGTILVGEETSNRIRMISPDLTSISVYSGDYKSDNINVEVARYNQPSFMKMDDNGDILLSDGQNGIRKILNNGTIRTLFSSGMNRPNDADYFSDGQVAIADQYASLIRKGRIGNATLTTIGNGPLRFTGDKQALNTVFSSTYDGAYHPVTKELWICDSGFHRVRKLGNDGNVMTMIGNGNSGTTAGPAVSSPITGPQRIAFKSNGDAYILANDGQEIRFYTASTSQLSLMTHSLIVTNERIESITTDESDNLIILRRSGKAYNLNTNALLFDTLTFQTKNFFRMKDGTGVYYIIGGNAGKIWKFTPGSGTSVTVYAGDGTDDVNDNIDRSQLKLGYMPNSIVVRSNGDMYFPDGLTDSVRIISTSTGKVTRIPRSSNYLMSFKGLALDPYDNLMGMSQSENVVRQYNDTTSEWKVVLGGAGDGSSALEVYISSPIRLFVDRSTDDVYFFDMTTPRRIRKISNGMINSIYTDIISWGFKRKNDGTLIILGPQIIKIVNGEVVSRWGLITSNTTLIAIGRTNGIPLDQAVFTTVSDMIEISSGEIVFVEQYYHVVRMISNGKVYNIAGTYSTQGYSGDGQDATLAKINIPISLLEVDGAIVFTDSGNSVIRKLSYMCNGEVSSSVNVCSGHGSCQFNGTCICQPGFSGVNCEESTCYGLTMSEGACNSNGQCTSLDNCTCNGDYYSFDCGVYCNANLNCSSNGVCDQTGQCSCNTDYYLNNCSVHCNAQTTCSGNGQCDSNGQCSCNTDYYLSNCSAYCNPQTSCSGHGQCGADGQCSCNNDYYLSNCSAYCNPQTSCGGHGQCDSNGICSCSNDYYLNNCSVFCNAQTTCHGNGQCDSNGKCSCSNDYYLNDCSVFCNAQTTCHGNGQCDSIGQCVCSNGYTGTFCDVAPNNGGNNYNSNNNSTNNNGGNNNNNSNNNSTNTSNNSTNTGGNNNNSNNNSNSGNNSTNTTGGNNSTNNGGSNNSNNNISTGMTCFGILSNDSNVCNGHGICQSNDQCSCHSSDQTGYWAGLQCSSCQSGYDGTNCQVETSSIGANSIDDEVLASQQRSLLFILILLIIIPVIILLIIIVIVIIVIVRRKGKRKPKEVEEENEMAVNNMMFTN